MFVDQGSAFGAAQPGRPSAIETGTKLYISNLDYGVSNEDVKVCFVSRFFEFPGLFSFLIVIVDV